MIQLLIPRFFNFMIVGIFISDLGGCVPNEKDYFVDPDKRAALIRSRLNHWIVMCVGSTSSYTLLPCSFLAEEHFIWQAEAAKMC